MKRRLLILGAFLMLGIAMNFTAASVLALVMQRSFVPMQFAKAGRAVDGREVTVSRREAIGVVALAAAAPSYELNPQPGPMLPLHKVVPDCVLEELLGWAQSEAQPTPAIDAARGVLITGWPVPSMWSSFDQQPSPGYWWFKARNGIVVAPALGNSNPFAPLSPRELVLPTRIDPGRFCIGTLFWAALCGVVTIARGALRREWRRRCGRCTACGYDLRHAPHEVCPECGSPAAAGGCAPR